MSIIGGFNPGQISAGEQQGYDSSSLQTGDLLSQLEGRVSATLEKMDNPLGSGAAASQQAVNPQDVAHYMAQISDQPIAGTYHSAVV